MRVGTAEGGFIATSRPNLHPQLPISAVWSLKWLPPDIASSLRQSAQRHP